MLPLKSLSLALLMMSTACGSNSPTEEPISPTPTPISPVAPIAPPAMPSTPPVSPVAPATPATPQLNLQRIVTEDLRIPYHNESRGMNINVFGRITAPENFRSHKLPLVILSPGFGNNLEFIANQYATDIARLGFVTYSLEFYGGNARSRTGGSMTEMSPFTEVDDLTAVLKALRNESFVDADKVILLGFSQGGVVSAITAATYPTEVKGLVLMNAALVLFDDARKEFSSVDVIPEIVRYKGATLGRIYFERSLNYDIYDTLKAFSHETLIVQGDRDDIVPLRYAQRANEVLPKSRLHVVQNAGHIFNNQQNRAIFPTLQSYLQDIIK